ncbi:MAG: hypothetical protein OXC13_11025 [Caldilineaceae bacterium]|nr:hypothetical protein [Caldilineaceae bacterium]
MILADASPLIVLAKLRRLELLYDLYGEVLIGPVVKAETIDAGNAIRARGVEQLEHALERGWLQMACPTAGERSFMEGLVRRSRLDRGEAEAIAFASTRDLRLIVDDKEARSVAVATGVKIVGTAGVLLEACLGAHLDREELEAVLQDLVQVLWISPAVVAEILRLAREARI